MRTLLSLVLLGFCTACPPSKGEGDLENAESPNKIEAGSAKPTATPAPAPAPVPAKAAPVANPNGK